MGQEGEVRQQGTKHLIQNSKNKLCEVAKLIVIANRKPRHEVLLAFRPLEATAIDQGHYAVVTLEGLRRT